MGETVSYPIVNGLIKVPPWEPRLDPCEWAAVLRPDPEGNIEKDEFLSRGDEVGTFFVDKLYMGAAVVFAADYIVVGPRGGKKKTLNRWYGVVRALGTRFVEIEPFASDEKAILATDIARERVHARALGKAESSRKLSARRDQLLIELTQVEYLLGVDALMHMSRFDASDA